MVDSKVVPLRRIHDSAVIHASARLGVDVCVGPYAVIGENAVIGDHCEIMAHAVIEANTVMGNGNKVFPGAVIGAEPQDLKFRGESSCVVIGDNNRFRECMTVNRATGEGGKTIIGSGCLFMAYTHVAHNCLIGNNVVLANSVALAGHIEVDDRVVIGGLAGVHQFVKIGRNAMIGGASKVVHDVPPFVIADGRPAKVCGLNSVGLSRAGMSRDVRQQIKQAYKILYRSGLSLSEAIAVMEQELEMIEEIEQMLRFLRNAERGICRERRDSDEDGGDN
ncbi:MAG: acyl-ACP--UDP-N-acetylglucosamine O-acyltransferase [Negativicutes bacterium]|nr:acyl-ACP--UDP-N-acetylglucosamine O-acyltransferase [Negativicutes bacterium]